MSITENFTSKTMGVRKKFLGVTGDDSGRVESFGSLEEKVHRFILWHMYVV